MKRILIITSLLIILLCNAYNCFAFEMGEKDLIALELCERYLKYQGVDRIVNYVVYQKDGIEYPAYCINPEFNGVMLGAPYSVSGNTKITDENVWRAIINGYPYKTISELGVANKEEAYTATKFAVFTLLLNHSTSDYSAIETDAGRRTYQAYLKIVENARNSQEVLKDNDKLKVTSENENWQVDAKDPLYVSKTYIVENPIKNAEYKVNISNLPKDAKITNIENQEQTNFKVGEKFKVLILLSSLNENGKFKVDVSANLETKPVIYGKTSIQGTQNYAIAGYMREDSFLSFEEKYLENITKIKIVKKEYGTEKILKGVKFNLLDLNKNILAENLVTDENGEILIEKMNPGKYFIKEIETLEGYNLYEDLIEVEVKLNEEVEVLVNNTVKSSSQINDINAYVEVTPQYTETVYNVEKANTILSSNTKTKTLPVTGY